MTMTCRIVSRLGRGVSWLLYWSGHLTSRFLVPISPTVFYPMYNNLICWSIDIDDWGVEYEGK